MWDSGSGGSLSVLGTSSSNTYTATGLSGGTTYVFQIAARNKYGIGPYSTDLSVVAG